MVFVPLVAHSLHSTLIISLSLRPPVFVVCAFVYDQFVAPCVRVMSGPRVLHWLVLHPPKSSLSIGCIAISIHTAAMSTPLGMLAALQ